MARHSTSAFNECSATRMLAERLESSGKIKTFFKENDRTPNYDGSMELVGHEGVPTKQFIVQIKKAEDLTANTKSGLDVAVKVLSNVDGIAFCNLTSKDVVRHPLVQKIVKAYEDYESKQKNISQRKQNIRKK